MSTDIRGLVTCLNQVAENLTGWSREEAAGHRLEEVFQIIDATTREPVPNPMVRAIRENKTVQTVFSSSATAMRLQSKIPPRRSTTVTDARQALLWSLTT